MAMYFECAARYDKTLDNGAVKKLTEKFLVDAVSFTEAETIFIERLIPLIGEGFSIPAIKKTRIAEIFNPDAERFYLAKVAFITIDEKSGVERKSVTQMLVGGNDIDDAKENFERNMSGTISDYDLQSLSDAAYVEIFLR